MLSFLDPEYVHGLKRVISRFLLMELIQAKGISNTMDTCVADREVPSDKGGFIDLVISEKDNEGNNNSAIVLENKVKADSLQ